MEWIINNKEWVFSGVGVAAISIIVGVLRSLIKKNKADRIVNMTGKNVTYIENNHGDINIK